MPLPRALQNSNDSSLPRPAGRSDSHCARRRSQTKWPQKPGATWTNLCISVLKRTHSFCHQGQYNSIALVESTIQGLLWHFAVAVVCRQRRSNLVTNNLPHSFVGILVPGSITNPDHKETRVNYFPEFNTRASYLSQQIPHWNYTLHGTVVGEFRQTLGPGGCQLTCSHSFDAANSFVTTPQY